MKLYNGKQNDISPKQKRFVDEYLIDFNGTQAAIRAGYSTKTAKEQASRLLTKVNVKEFIKGKQKEYSEELKLNILRTLQEIIKIAFFDPRKYYEENGNLKPIKELDDPEAAALISFDSVRRVKKIDNDSISVIVDKIKFANKTKSLELLAKVQGLYTEKFDVKFDENLGVIRLPEKLPVGAPCEVPEDME